MCCPYFDPQQLPSADAAWPLGGIWEGRCAARSAGERADGSDMPAPAEFLAGGCNLGAPVCPHFPAGAEADRISFSLGRESGERVEIRFALERRHHPVACGSLHYDRLEGRFALAVLHPAAQDRLLRQASAFLQAQPRPVPPAQMELPLETNGD